MAKTDKKTVVFMLFVFVYVGFVITAATRTMSRGLLGREPVCTSVVGVQTGDSCFGIAQKYKLSSGFFDYINPNLNCKKLFVGEWICVDGL